MQETCSGDGEASLVQLRIGEEGSVDLCTRAKGDMLNHRRKLSSWALQWGEKGLEWQLFREGLVL